jgi:N6-adenosine-specific RNA methylase IME4
MSDALPTNKLYGVIYADPPWSYVQSGVVGGVKGEYITMTDAEICALPVPAADDAVLYLWATSPLLPIAFDVIKAWGFSYKSSAVWDKERPGIGFWFIGQHEHLLVGVRGNVRPPVPSLRISSVIRCRRGLHSRKPDYVRDRIAAWFPDVPRLEMFTRLKCPGWDAFGNQVEHDLLSA